MQDYSHIGRYITRETLTLYASCTMKQIPTKLSRAIQGHIP